MMVSNQSLSPWTKKPNHALISTVQFCRATSVLSKLMHKYMKMNWNVFGRLLAPELFQRIVDRLGKEKALQLFFSFSFDKQGKTFDEKKYQRLIKLVIQSCVELRKDGVDNGVHTKEPLSGLAINSKIALRPSHKELVQNAKRYVQKFSNEAKQFFDVLNASRDQQDTQIDDKMKSAAVSVTVLLLSLLALKLMMR